MPGIEQGMPDKDVHVKLTHLGKICLAGHCYFFEQIFCCRFVRPPKFFSHSYFPGSIFFDVSVAKAVHVFGGLFFV